MITANAPSLIVPRMRVRFSRCYHVKRSTDSHSVSAGSDVPTAKGADGLRIDWIALGRPG
jgi:hypothetical protein